MNDLAIMEERALTAQEIKAQVQLIQQVMDAVMEKDVHYGTIPGTPKPTLYKAGAEKILTTFRIAAYPKEIDDLSTGDEIRYRVKVHGIHQTSGILIGVGIGECSSNEEKYKWRRPVCDEEFNETPEDRRREVWKRGRDNNYKQKQIRTNPSDVANTILKMAKKRAQIDMTLTATAASDVFDQDLEDLPGGIVEGMNEQKAPLKGPQKKQATKREKPEIAGTAENVLISEATSKEGTSNGKPYTIYTIIDEHGEKYGTFDVAHFRAASFAHDNFLPATIKYSDGKYGKRVEEITVPNMEPGQE